MKVTKLEDLPDYFYKYRSLIGAERDFTREILLEHALYWSSPLAFNDPFECSPVPEMPKGKLAREFRLRRLIRKKAPAWSKAKRREMLSRSMRVPPGEFEDHLRSQLPELMKNIAVCSLAATAESVLMWSHYADAHRGLCLRFRPLTKDSRAPHISEKTYFEFAFPVLYSAERPILRIPTEDPLSAFEATLLTKADFWAYEEEWRLIGHEQPPGPKPFPPECLDAVILGARMPDADREAIREWAAQRDRPLTILEAKFDRRLFRLNFG